MGTFFKFWFKKIKKLKNKYVTRPKQLKNYTEMLQEKYTVRLLYTYIGNFFKF